MFFFQTCTPAEAASVNKLDGVTHSQLRFRLRRNADSSPNSEVTTARDNGEVTEEKGTKIILVTTNAIEFRKTRENLPTVIWNFRFFLSDTDTNGLMTWVNAILITITLHSKNLMMI